MKKSEIFTELSVKLAQLEAKINWLIEQPKKGINKPVLWDINTNPVKQKCLWEGMKPGEPACLSCPCPKCTPYCLSGGSLSDGGSVQTWRPSGDTNL